MKFWTRVDRLAVYQEEGMRKNALVVEKKKRKLLNILCKYAINYKKNIMLKIKIICKNRSTTL